MSETLTFHILTREESAENDRILRFECPCEHEHHHGLFDGRTRCVRPTNRAGLCFECRKWCKS